MRSYYLIFAAIILLAALLASCSQKEPISKPLVMQEISLAEPPAPDMQKPTEIGMGDEASSPTEEQLAPDPTAIPAAINKKKIIKDGEMSVKAKDLAQAKREIDALLHGLNAYYETEAHENNSSAMFYKLKIRVPAVNFEKMMNAIEQGKNEIVSKSINARDVTEEYVDVETRLKSKREYLKKYLDLLSKTTSVKDALSVQASIQSLQEEIESKEGRLRYLNDQVAYSTLDLHLFQLREYVYKSNRDNSFGERVKEGLHEGWVSVVDFILGLINHWPAVLLVLTALFTIKPLVRKVGRLVRFSKD